jgi:hypothetical protein
MIEARGRLSALAELGAGFHPDLTGRENIFLNGTILGLSRGAVRQRFDEIVAFSELETFIDTPVKRYSSGMVIRLGFAVAASIHPEILLVTKCRWCARFRKSAPADSIVGAEAQASSLARPVYGAGDYDLPCTSNEGELAHGPAAR